jgi:trans-2-enoyl-CoA reductase
MRTVEMRKKAKKYLDDADGRIVKMVYSLLEADRKYDWWDDLPASVQKSIIKAEKELDAGKGIPHEVVMEKYRKWFTK